MLLLSLKVEKLVLPAAEEAESIWTKKLGFRKMRDEQVSELLDLFTWLPTWNLLLVFQMLNVLPNRCILFCLSVIKIYEGGSADGFQGDINVRKDGAVDGLIACRSLLKF